MTRSLKNPCRTSTSSQVDRNIAEKPPKCHKGPNSSESSPNNLRKQAVIHYQEKPFKCPKCPYLGKTSYYLKRHNIKHSKEKPFKCSKCDFSCKRSTNLINHMVIHSKEKPFKCPKCPYSGKTSVDLKRHFVRHSNEKPFKCSKCPYSGKRSRDIKSHDVIHSKEKPFKCSDCPYSCKRPSELTHHRLIHENPFRCNICLKDFTRPDKLQIHMKTHSRPSKPFKCHYCNASSTSLQALKDHRVLYHPQNPVEKQRALLCSFPPCEFKTLKKLKLAKHLGKHLRKEPFKCILCGFSALNNRCLDLHILSCHPEKGGSKEYSCKLCGKKFGVNELLAVHNEQVHGIPFVVLQLFPLF